MSIASLYGRARLIVLAVGVASMLGLGVGPVFAEYNNPDTDWMRDGKYGIYLKYLNWTPRDTSSAEYNQWVDAFDVDKFAETVELTGASWVIWGLGRVWFNSPNATLDGFVGDFTSNRDLPLEIANALQERGIKFMLYAAADKTESENDPLGKLALGWGLNNRYTSTYVNNWADVLQVWSDRYGTRVSGWWIDHAYPRYAVSVTARGASNPELAIYRDHLLSGNSDGIVAFNHGWQDLDAHTPEEDYRSGHERAIAESVASSRWWHGLQWHYLSRLGPGLWGSEGVRYDTQVLIDYVNENNRHEGANTFSVFVYSKPGESAEGIVKSPGNLSNAQLRQLSALRDASLQFVDDTSDDVSFVGTWERQDDELDFRGSMTGSDDADAHAELAFSGIGVEVVVRKGRNGGLVDVELDGDVVLDDFDTYSRTTAFKQIIYTNKNLDAGSHTVRLVATGRKSAAATAADAMLDNFAVTMADTMRPRVLSVTSDASHPTKNSFTVTIDFLEDVTGLRAGEISVSNGSVSNFAGSGASYTLDIAPTAGLEGEVTVDVPANAVVDGASNGNLQGSETFAVDTRAPVIQTAVANQAVLTLVYGEALDPLSVPPASAFTLTGGGAPRTISNIVVNGSRVVLSMDPPASYGEAGLQVGYSAPSGGALADALGNKVPSFTNQAVANESPGTTPSTDTWITGATAFSVREGDTALATLTATEAATAAGDPVWWIPSGAAGGPDGGKFVLSRAGVLTFAAAKDFEAPDDANADGSYQVTVRLSVGALTAAADLTVTLTDRNEAPVANAHANQLIVAQGATVTLSGSGSDPDADDTLTYAWTQTGTPAVALSDTAAASPTFTAPSSLTEDTTLSFTLRVADSSDLYHEDTVSVTVQKDPLLTAAFENAPARHDGSTPFAVDLRFSEEVALWYSAFTSGLLTTTGGTVQRASRLVPRSNIGWRIPVTPDGDGDVVITLPANRACSWLTGACARDGRKLAVAASVTVPGPAPGPAPDITSAAAFTVQEGETAVGTLAATDADTAAADLVWTIPSGTAGGADAGKFTLGRAGVLTFAAAKDYEAPDDVNTDGAYQVTVQVSDGASTDSGDLTVTLANVNEAPTAHAGADQDNVVQGATVTLGGTGTDPDDGDALTYAWTRTGGPSATLSDTAVAGPTFTAPDDLTQDAELTFRLRVSDTGGLYDEDSVTVTVRAGASTGPAATLVVLNEDFDDGDVTAWTVYDGSWSVTEGAYGVNGGGERKAVAAEVDVADFVLEAEVRVKSTSGDAGVVFRVNDPGTGTDNYKGYYVGVDSNSSLVFGKADAGRWQELDRVGLAFTLSRWYRLKVVASGASIRVYVDEVLKFDATDASYDRGAIGLRTWRAEADWDNVTVSRIVEEDSVGFRVSAADAEIDEGGASTVTVATANGETFAEAQRIALSVSGSASTADYELASTGLTLAAGSAAVSVVLTAVDDEAEEAAETVTVTAARGGSEIGSATVTIRASDEPEVEDTAAPEIGATTSFTVDEGTTAVGTLTATDADTAAAALTWSILSGADAGKLTLTPRGVLAFAAAKDYEAPDDTGTDGAYHVTVQVSDGANTDSGDLTVTLANVNEAPTAGAGDDQTSVVQDSTVTLAGSGMDPDADDTLSYAWTKTAGPAVTLNNAEMATATFTAPSGLTTDAAFTFKLKVTDAGGLFHEDSVAVTVKGSDPAATIAAGTSPVTEGTAATFTVSLDKDATESLSVTVTVTESESMLSGTPPTSVAFAVGDRTKTVTAATADDAVIETDSTVTAALGTGSDYTLGTASSVEVTVKDDDTATWQVSAAEASIDEGDATTLTVAVANGKTFAGEQSIALTVSGTAAGSDYSLTSSPLALAAGSSLVTATLTAADDTDEESAETVTVAASHGGSSIGSVTVTIRANDVPLAQVTGVTVTELVESLSVTWTAVAGGDGYRVQWREDGEAYEATRQHTVAGGLTSQTIEGLAADTSYWLRVAATKAGADDGPWSAEASGTPRASEAGHVDGDLRLVGGEEDHEGRVEVYHDGEWGTVCDDYWGIADARVACRQLGFANANEAPRRARFGEGGGPIWMDNMDCTGAETVLADCQFRGWGVHNCRHREDAGAVCTTGVDEGASAAGLRDPGVGAPEFGRSAEGPAGTVPAHDGSLSIEEAVETALGVNPASDLEVLDLTDRKLGDLAGVERLTGLRVLRLRGNAVADISPLAGLHGLRELDLSDNAVADLWPLAGLSNLGHLDLSDNAVSDLSPLVGLERLTALALDDNAVADLSPLARLPGLTRLRLSRNRIGDLSPLYGLTGLRELVLSGNAVVELWPLAQLSGLERLYLAGNLIEDPGPLAGLSSLQVLDLARNRIETVNGLARLDRVQTLKLDRNRLSVFYGLAGLESVEALSLRGNAVEDVNPLAPLANLRWLDLRDNPVSDLAPLAEWPVVVWLDGAAGRDRSQSPRRVILAPVEPVPGQPEL